MARRRRRGTGTVFFSKTEGAWIARVSLGGGRSRKARADSPTAARQKLERLLGERSSGDLARTTLDVYLSQWLRDVEPSIRDSTLTSYAGHVRLHISPLLGGIPVTRLGPQDVRRLIADRLAAGLSPATVGHVITTLKMALAVAVRDGALTRNPADVRLPRAERRHIEAMTPEQARAILRAAEDDELGALYVLLLGSGMRLGEACALDWADVDLDAATVRIRTGKTRAATRTVMLPPFVVSALRRHRTTISGPVFTGSRRGYRLRPDVATHAFPRMLGRAGLPRLRVHDLRHGHATLLLAAGTPMRVIAEQLGHASPSITANVYAHVVPGLQQEGAARLESLVVDEIRSHNGSR